MGAKITISLDEDIVDGLRDRYGKGQISHFINSVLRPYFSQKDLANAYNELANEYQNDDELKKISEDFQNISLEDIPDETW